jgi:hypothetical protein
MKSPDDFTDKKELQKYVKLLIGEIGICPSIRKTNAKAYSFLFELFNRHPDKDTKKIHMLEDIKVTRHLYGEYLFTMLLTDGTTDTISWIACVTQKTDNFNQQFNKACRNTVNKQINAQKKKGGKGNRECIFCKSKKELTVDHVIEFIQLLTDFMIKFGGPYPTEVGRDNSISRLHCFLHKDHSFKKEWETYHLSNAEFQTVCKQCISKTNTQQNRINRSRNDMKRKSMLENQRKMLENQRYSNHWENVMTSYNNDIIRENERYVKYLADMVSSYNNVVIRDTERYLKYLGNGMPRCNNDIAREYECNRQEE